MKVFLVLFAVVAVTLAAVGPFNSRQPRQSYNYDARPYNYYYTVKDELSNNDYGHQQSSDGQVVTGTYYVLLPDGRRQVVNYRADSNGYVADVKYEGVAAAASVVPSLQYRPATFISPVVNAPINPPTPVNLGPELATPAEPFYGRPIYTRPYANYVRATSIVQPNYVQTTEIPPSLPVQEEVAVKAPLVVLTQAVPQMVMSDVLSVMQDEAPVTDEPETTTLI